MRANDNTPVYAYLRVSSASQVEGDGFDRQRDKICAWAKAHKHSVRFTFQDEGVSGTLDTAFRPALANLVAAIAALPPEEPRPIVVVEKADRLARDLIVGELILRQFREAGITVIEAEGGSDLTTGSDNPTATLIRQILSAVAEFEKTSLVNKMRAARQRIKASGERCEGRRPFGATPAEGATLAQMRWLHGLHHSTRQIAAVLNRDNDLNWADPRYPSRSGKPWTHGAVAKILNNTKTKP